MTVLHKLQEWADALDFAPADDQDGQKRNRAVARTIVREMRDYIREMGCPKCGRLLEDGDSGRRLPCPYGSLNAAAPIVLCTPCYIAFVAMTWQWLGRELPPDAMV